MILNPIHWLRHSKRRGWVHAEAVAELRKRRYADRPLHKTVRLLLQERPVVIASAFHLLFLGLSVLLKFFSVPLLSILAPKDSATILATAWQVHAGFVAIAFAGLAILFQTTSPQQIISPERLRSILFRRTYFSAVLVFCIIGAAELGIVASWLPSDGALLIQVIAVVVASMLFVGSAYFRATKALTQPEYAIRKAEDELIEILHESLGASRAMLSANNRLDDSVGFHYRPADGKESRGLVMRNNYEELDDVHLPTVIRAMEELKKLSIHQNVSQTNVDVSDLSEDGEDPPRLILISRIGAELKPGDQIFLVSNPAAYRGNWRKLESQLSGAVKTRRESI